jgi:hypothetical protein
MAVKWMKGEKAGTTEYTGVVLKKYEVDERVMSDMWEIISYVNIWTGEKVKKIPLGLAYNSDWVVTVDATHEVRAAAEVWENERAEIKRRKLEAESILNLSEIIRRGDTVKVVKGRKIRTGTVAVVFWVGDTQWGRSVGLEIDGKREFTSFGNVQRVLSEGETKQLEYAKKELELV